MRELVFDSHDEMHQLMFGQRLAKCVDNTACVIFLQGDLGAGKTTLVRGFLRAMGYVEKVKSPTYTLIEIYNFPEHAHTTVLHIDLYRLKNPDEIEGLSLRDYLQEKTIFIIEWSENAESKLPLPDLSCSIAVKEEGRQLHFKAHTQRGEEILQHMGTTA